MTNLKDTCFLLGYLSKRVTQNALVIEAKRCDPSHNGRWDNVCTIISAPNSNFENCRIDLRLEMNRVHVAQTCINITPSWIKV
jgi:hypothetical protein